MFNDCVDYDCRIFIIDTKTRDYHEVISSESLSIAPDMILPWPALSPDNRSIYVERSHRESDIWMLRLGDQE